MKTVGIKLADGSFYPIMEEGTAQTKKLDLTTANNNQTCVMVDLYRSKTCSMDDAEYIDTLKIENLIAHPNGEPNISFSVNLDENGELSAKIVDSETGAESDSSITLISRTTEERLVPDDYTIDGVSDNQTEDDSNKNNVAAGVIAGVAAGAGLLAAAQALNETDFDDIPATNDDLDFADIPTSDETDVNFDEIPLPEDSLDSNETLTSDDSTKFTDTTSDLPDFDDIPATNDDLDFADIPTSDETDINFDEIPLPEDPLDSNETIASDDSTNFTDTTSDLPDFDDIPATNDDLDFADIPTSDDDLNFGETPSSDDNLNFDDDFFDSNSDAGEISGGNGLSFTGLYDKETEMGDSSFHEEENSPKKVKIPVIICIICAVICILATVFVLFIIPSKYNLTNKKKNQQETTVVETKDEKTTEKQAEIIEEEVPLAKEDEIIIIEEAEKVVPLPPPVEEEKKISEITYKIKWGDTLWDIADTFYKNPWRYKKIAAYNNIKNPDYIISGTIIKIPTE